MINRPFIGILCLCACFCYYPVLANSRYHYTTINDKRFKAVTVNPSKLQLHWQNTRGRAYNNFSSLNNALKDNNQNVTVMMNAGIYTQSDQPAGLHIENGHQIHAINQKHGHGNFHLQPNGVFFITQKHQPAIRTTASFYKKYGNQPEKTVRLATQSGPILVQQGQINPRLKANSQSLYSRNGVCVSKDDKVIFFATANFYRSNLFQFAQAAQAFGCHNALYLDGSISKLYVKGENSIFHLSHFVGILTETE